MTSVAARVERTTTSTTESVCSRSAAGGEVANPPELRSHNGVLKVDLAFRGFRAANGEMRYCYVSDRGAQSPSLRLRPGDLLILNLTNELPPGSQPDQGATAHPHKPKPAAKRLPAPTICAGDAMSPLATNLHFHGLAVPPVCHADDVLRTLLTPGSSFQYRIRIPGNQPSGLYWYHPHPHGSVEAQVLGGASGALIVEGIESENPILAGLPERVLVIRDQRNADGRPGKSAAIEDDAYVPEKPSNDLSINSVPIPYPDYPPAIITAHAGTREFWRVLNASADTYLDIQIVKGRAPRPLGVVALDGVSIWHDNRQQQIQWNSDIPLPPGARAEFLVDVPAENTDLRLVTLGVQTGPLTDDDLLFDPNTAATVADDDDHMPPRPLARISTAGISAAPLASLPVLASPKTPRRRPAPTPLSRAETNRTRKLYFSEGLLHEKDPTGPKTFMITEEGRLPKVFDPASVEPDITVRQGDVEDWTIENRSQESHVFHIHQTHFRLLERDGTVVDEPYLRDTVAIPYWDGDPNEFPSVKLRLDFRSPGITGTFPYHCHVLLHEDGGMMGTIRVQPAKR